MLGMNKLKKLSKENNNVAEKDLKLPFKVLKAVFIILGACKKRNKTV